RPLSILDNLCYWALHQLSPFPFPDIRRPDFSWTRPRKSRPFPLGRFFILSRFLTLLGTSEGPQGPNKTKNLPSCFFIDAIVFGFRADLLRAASEGYSQDEEVDRMTAYIARARQQATPAEAPAVAHRLVEKAGPGVECPHCNRVNR
ncbi:unnamed protein product, partial [Prorocentrum cordatum]